MGLTVTESVGLTKLASQPVSKAVTLVKPLNFPQFFVLELVNSEWRSWYSLILLETLTAVVPYII